MNDLTVVQATQGLCQYLVSSSSGGLAELRERGVALGFDHRAVPNLGISSARFAALAAQVFLSREVPVKMVACGGAARGSPFAFSCTPMVPFAVKTLGCAAGVMVTASHNPKEDDGYKVYWGNGSQIIPPHDKGIAADIEKAQEPWDFDAYSRCDLESILSSALVEDVTATLSEQYFAEMSASLCYHRAGEGEDDDGRSEFSPTYTAMHGVGHAWVKGAFKSFGLLEPVPTKEQVDPDHTFPTVAFPNPEEGEGALKLSMATAERSGSNLVLANDPDADRLAVAERDAGTGKWTIFTGNEIGLLLAWWQWHNHCSGAGKAEEKVAMLASTVSSKALGAMAEKEGFLFEDTPTGFKWLGNRSLALRKEGYKVLLSYEEAIGFCLGDVVCDKDGVSAAAAFTEMAWWLQKKDGGKTVVAKLAELRERYGHFVSNNSYVFCRDPALIGAIFSRLRTASMEDGGGSSSSSSSSSAGGEQGHRFGGRYWEKLGRFEIDDVRDLTGEGYDSRESAAGFKPKMPTGSGNMITLVLLSSPLFSSLLLSSLLVVCV